MYKLSQLLSHYYWQKNIKKENSAPNNEEQKAAVLIMSPVEELWLVFRTATGNRVSVWTQESFQNRFQKFFKSRLRMIVWVSVVPLLTMTDVSTNCAVVDIIRFIFRIYLKYHCPCYFLTSQHACLCPYDLFWTKKVISLICMPVTTARPVHGLRLSEREAQFKSRTKH